PQRGAFGRRDMGQELIEIIWMMVAILAVAYAGLCLLALLLLPARALCFYTGELLLYCFVRGYRIRRNPFTAHPMPEHRRLSENSFLIGLLFWIILFVLLYVIL
ncbi:MAG: hypothetical protein V1792_24945, partial [Pseudomonadota bacterium]